MNLTTFTLRALLLTAGLTETKMDIAEDNVPAEVDLSQLAEAALASVNEVHLLRAYIEANIPVLLVPESEADFILSNYEEIGAATIFFFREASPLAALHRSNKVGEYFVLTSMGGIRRILENISHWFRRSPARSPRRVLDAAEELVHLQRRARINCTDEFLHFWLPSRSSDMSADELCDKAIQFILGCFQRNNVDTAPGTSQRIREQLSYINVCSAIF